MGQKNRAAVRYFIGRSFMRDGLVRLSVFPKTAQTITKVNEMMDAAGYTPADRETWLRRRMEAQEQLSKLVQ